MTLPPDGPFAENLALFRERFPGLYGMYAAPLSAPDAALAALEGEGMEVLEARSGKPSLRFAGRLIHSLQDPQKEAERLLDAEVKALGEAPGSFVFYGFGLGYLPAAAAEKFPGAALALIEPDVRRFILALGWVDWRRVFASPSCAVFLGADVHTAADFVEGLGEGRVIFSLPQYTAHGGDYFSALKTLVNLRVQKKHVNARTLDAFGKRWLRNSARNLPMLASCPGVNRLSGRAGGLPCCVLAAGPTLDSVIPFLEDLSRRSVVIAVDTALRACLRAGVEPDFVVLGDPQFWNAQHLSGLCARSSILVTEIACYPPVMRFPCRGVVLFDSLYPLGEYFSRALSLPKGALASGGSVAASAWDLARVLGAGEIWVAGLDLGFPGGRTHARGSLFEETIHARSVRLAPAETQGAAALFSARSVLAGDYHGVPLRSDERMTLYAWWFESEVPNAPAQTCSLTPGSRALRGVRVIPMREILSKPEIQKEGLFEGITGPGDGALGGKLRQEQERLRQRLLQVRGDAEGAAALCRAALEKRNPAWEGLFKTLDGIDRRIRENPARQALSLAFPSPQKLEAEFAALPPERDPRRANMRRSLTLYSRIADAGAECAKALTQAGASQGA